MDHPNLPPMEEFDINGTTLNGHNLRNDFVYVCVNQQDYSGKFYLIGHSGLFSVGAYDWVSNYNHNNEIPISINVVKPDGSTRYSRRLYGNQQTNIFLETNDNFYVSYEPDGEDSVDIDSLSQFIITRLSKNPYYKYERTLAP